MGKVYVGDVGTIIEIDMGEDISTATNLKLIVQKPNMTEVEWIPTIYGTNYLRYKTVANDLNTDGRYMINPVLTLGEWSGSADTVFFDVFKEGQ